jgi:predicted permease
MLPSRWFAGLSTDVRHGVRMLRASPLFALVVVVTLALGIGPNAAMFSVMNAVMLRRLPVPEPDRLVYLRTSGIPRGASNTGSFESSFSYSVFTRLRERRDAFSDLMAYVPLAITKTAVRADALPEEASAEMVSGNFFSGLRVGAACGRLLTAEDESHRSAVVVLSHGYWSRRFGKDCAAVGRTLYVKGQPFTVVGVARAGFLGVSGRTPTDLWIPLQDRQGMNAWGMSRDRSFVSSPEWWCLLLIARLAPGVSEPAAVAALQPLFGQAAYAELGRPRAGDEVPRLSVVQARGITGLREAYQDPVRLLFVMVALVLVIACGNVALLLIARNVGRQREFAVRSALGGGRGQLLRQLLVESLLLVVAATGLGWLFAVVATDAIATWADLRVSLAPDQRVLLFTVAVSAVATLVFGLAPVRIANRVGPVEALRTTLSTGDRARTWGRKVVVGLQAALCLVLLIGAGLTVRNLRSLERIPLGMRAAGLLVFGVSPQPRVSSHDEMVAFYQALLERLRALAGVEAATIMESRLGSGWSNNTNVWVDGRVPSGRGKPTMRWNVVGPDYFQTLGIPLLHGRELRDGDGPRAAKVAVVNATFASWYLPGGSPLGHRIAMSADGDDGGYEIVGVVADSKYIGVREDPIPTGYFFYRQMSHVGAMHVELRVQGPAQAFLAPVQGVLRELAPDLPLEQPRTQEQQFALNLSEDRLVARLATFFGVLAMLLVGTGLYGTLAYAVSQRTSEIGVRVALGGRAEHVVWMVLRESLLVCAVGAAVGLPVALAGGHLLRASLYGVSPADPVSIVGAVAALVAVAVTASLLPARRALSVAPIVALRAE